MARRCSRTTPRPASSWATCASPPRCWPTRGSRGFLDFDRPLGLILNAVVHHLLDEEDPSGIVATFKDVLAPGSMMQLTHFSDASPESKANEQVLKQSLGRGQVRTREQITAFFDGLEILAPGIVFLPQWRPEGPLPDPLPPGGTLMLVGVGRKP